jgi:hypothetical protein
MWFTSLLKFVTSIKHYALNVLHTSEINRTHYIYSVSSSCLITAPNNRRFHSSGFPNCPQSQLPDSHSNGSTPVNHRGYLTHWLTNQPTHWFLTFLANNISTRTAYKTQFLCCSAIVASKHACLRSLRSQSQSQSHIMTDSQSRCPEPIWDPRPIFLYPWTFI